MNRVIFLFFILILAGGNAQAQEPVKSRPSPLAIATARYKDAYLKITYGQPQRRSRVVFGELVPFGQVWRTGANEATEITITKDIIINQTVLPAGTYSLFTIPDEKKWTIIINADVGLWGAYNYNARVDVMRFDVTPQPIPTPYEAFTIQIEQRNNMAEILLLWDRVKVSIPFQFVEPKQP
jgi:hypothetical protein